jgi:hypothetical protein
MRLFLQLQIGWCKALQSKVLLALTKDGVELVAVCGVGLAGKIEPKLAGEWIQIHQFQRHCKLFLVKRTEFDRRESLLGQFVGDSTKISFSLRFMH